ncbi:hypothetical protein ACHWQZ_G019482 [Mnemiopsis leidyi]
MIWLLLCITVTTVRATSDWKSVQTGVEISHDLESIPFEIKTDGTAGSNKKLFIEFFGVTAGDPVGGFLINFYASPKFKVLRCMESEKVFPDSVSLPSNPINTWKIKWLRTSKEKRVVVHCNDVEVVNVIISDTECNDNVWRSSWSADIKKLKFNGGDTASKHYKEIKLCPELDVTNFQVSPAGPATDDTVVTVTCTEPKRHVLMGGNTVTCQSEQWKTSAGTPANLECRRCGKLDAKLNLFVMCNYRTGGVSI